MIILRQHEYTSIPRKIGAWLKRQRVNAADKLGDTIYKTSKSNNSLEEKLDRMPIVDNPELLKKSIREARDKYNARTINRIDYDFGLKKGTGVITTDGLRKKYGNKVNSEFGDKIGNSTKKNKYLILVDKRHETPEGIRYLGTDVTEHAHEVGHLKNNIRNRKYTQRANKYRVSGGNEELNKSNNTSEYLKAMKKSFERKRLNEEELGLDNGSGIKEYFRRLRDGNALVRDEKRASKNALDFLKQNGATREEVNRAKAKTKAALKSYKNSVKINRLLPLQNSIQIKSRRRK